MERQPDCPGWTLCYVIYWTVEKLHFSNISSPNERLTLLSIPDLGHCQDNEANVYTGLYSDPIPPCFCWYVCFTSRSSLFLKLHVFCLFCGLYNLCVCIEVREQL